MSKINSLIQLLVLNQDSAGLDTLCGVVKCRGVNCNECPLNTKDSMKVLLQELEAVNV